MTAATKALQLIKALNRPQTISKIDEGVASLPLTKVDEGLQSLPEADESKNVFEALSNILGKKNNKKRY